MLALRNLLHDRVRFIVTLVGIVFSVVLSAVQLGLFLGFTAATSNVIDRSGADLWVLSSGVTHIETGVPFSETLANLARGVDGVSVLIAAGLGLLVGVVVVAQTIYEATVDHIREYGTLKAMGATNGYIYRVIIKQATIADLIGYTLAIGVAALVAHGSQQGTTAILLPWPLAAALLALTLVMCISASVVSINKVTRLDPAMVLKG